MGRARSGSAISTLPPPSQQGRGRLSGARDLGGGCSTSAKDCLKRLAPKWRETECCLSRLLRAPAGISDDLTERACC
eukprot:910432-Pyramimonas_sp.AAC.1